MGIADVTIGLSDSTGATACTTLSGFSALERGPGSRARPRADDHQRRRHRGIWETAMP